MADNPPITCPACAKKFKPKADVRGKKIRCPFCTEAFVVPGGDVPSTAIEATPGRDAPKPEPAPAEPQAKPASVPIGAWEGEENDNPYGVTEVDIAPRCPNCAHEMVPQDAVVCLNCGYNTLTREWGKTEKTIGVSGGRQFVHLLPGFFSVFCLLLCLIDRLMYSVYMPFWIGERDGMAWTDHESLRMWGTMIGLAVIFALGRIAYNRFFVRPSPPEITIE